MLPMELATAEPLTVAPRARDTAPGADPGGTAAIVAADPAVPCALPDLPLDEVPFAVVDVETTGGSPEDGALTEVAVAVVVGGRCVEVFNRLVHPGVPIPPFITALTGISAATVAGAPVAGTVLPELHRVLAGRVLVGHNLPFDVGFLDCALQAAGLPTLDHVQVDTLVLARRLVGARMANCRLATLADALALAHRPSHRALADVWATADLLHHLLLRLRAHGILRLPQLMAFALGADLCRPSPQARTR